MSALKARVSKLESVRVDGPNPLALVLHRARMSMEPTLPEMPVTWRNTTLEELLAKVRHGNTR